jgi:hypothetical protein
VIADRHIFVVGKQRIVGPKQLADVGCVMDPDIEIGVVADDAGKVHPDLGLTDQLGFDIVPVAVVRKEFDKAAP